VSRRCRGSPSVATECVDVRAASIKREPAARCAHVRACPSAPYVSARARRCACGCVRARAAAACFGVVGQTECTFEALERLGPEQLLQRAQIKVRWLHTKPRSPPVLRPDRNVPLP
jgi:hypothetical protein